MSKEELLYRIKILELELNYLTKDNNTLRQRLKVVKTIDSECIGSFKIK